MKVNVFFLLLACVAITGCSCNNTDSLREHTADATAAAKRDAGAIASGIVEGLQRKGPLDINSATEKQLESLPGVTERLADAIVAGRPYEDSSQLYKKHIVTHEEYDRIKAQIMTKHPR